jgi:hypothetical protein
MAVDSIAEKLNAECLKSETGGGWYGSSVLFGRLLPLICGSGRNERRGQPHGQLGAVAEFERSLLLELQREGIAIAKAEGKYRGGRQKLTSEKAAELRRCAASLGRGKTTARSPKSLESRGRVCAEHAPKAQS